MASLLQKDALAEALDAATRVSPLGDFDFLQLDPSGHPFWAFDWSLAWQLDVALCSVVLCLAGVLCSAAGIGGGGVYVVVLMLVGQLSTHNAVPLSKAIVFFGAIASLLVNLQRQWSKQASPDSAASERAVIDVDACRLVVPTALVGTFLGVSYNHTAKASTIVVVLTGLLCFMTFMVVRTAWNQYCEETSAFAATDSEAVPLASSSHDLRGPPRHGATTTASGSAPAQRGLDSLAAQAPLQFDDNAKAPERGPLRKIDVALASVLMVIVVLSGVLRFHMHACRAEHEGHGLPGSCGHPLMHAMFGGRLGLWMHDTATANLLLHSANSLPLWSCLVIAVYCGNFVYRVSKWSAQKVVLYQVIALATGLLAGLVGVGGGLIFSPFFLLMGMEPSVAVATSSTCVLFTSSSTTMQYLLTDRVIMSLAFVYGLVTLMASYIGTSLVHILQDRFKGRRSYITMVVAGGVGLSAVLSLAKFVKLLCGFETTL